MLVTSSAQRRHHCHLHRPRRRLSLAASAVSTTTVTPTMILDSRPTLTRAEARSVYDGFAVKGHAGGRDASSGYGGPAVQALLAMAAFADARSVDR